MQYDFQEELISEHIPAINIPAMQLPMGHSPANPIAQLEQYLLRNQLQENKRKIAIQQKQKLIGMQIEKQLASRQDKIKRISQQERSKIESLCTFQPNTNNRKTPPRKLAQFLQEQNKFAEKVNLKKNILKKTLEESREKPTYHPNINQNNHHKPSSHHSQSVFERLYALKDKENEEFNALDTFQPQIQEKSKKISRNQPVQQLLYSDALRRQQKAKSIVKQSFQSKAQKCTTNLQNQKYAAQKFIKQYFVALEQLDIKSSKIEYLKFCELLEQLGFISSQHEPQPTYFSTQQRILLQSAYETLEKYAVNARNVCVFLLALQGIFSINPIHFSQDQENDSQFTLQEPEGRRLQKHYDLLKRNRLNTQKSSAIQMAGPSFQPRTNPLSWELADRHRAVMLEQANKLIEEHPETRIPADGVISHTDLLVLSNLAKEDRIKKQQQSKQHTQLEECTFKPNTCASHNATLHHPALGYNKSMQLYHHHLLNLTNKSSLQDINTHQSNIDKECTFTPHIKKQKIEHELDIYERKDVKQAVMRMRKGRETHEQKRKLLERGEPSNMTSRKNTASSVQLSIPEEEEAPTLILDVNLGDKMDRILIYSGDEHRLPSIAKAFAIKHSLQKSNQDKLLQMLDVELQNVLGKIDQDEEEEI